MDPISSLITDPRKAALVGAATGAVKGVVVGAVVGKVVLLTALGAATGAATGAALSWLSRRAAKPPAPAMLESPA
jgi:predicted lysophospholipase L1 biosynthesis ABC-type transport system permease subunit